MSALPSCQHEPYFVRADFQYEFALDPLLANDQQPEREIRGANLSARGLPPAPQVRTHGA